jgi:polynucleotide 5'-hydroxyl-kinase GRC3/NOL9
MTGKLEDFIKEDKIIEELLAPRNKLIMVLGGADTGKTTVIECIADLIARVTPVGIVDADMGQSHVGLPTTIAWGQIKGGFKDWQSIKTESFYFTGTLSPPGNLLPVMVGAKLITDSAGASCDKVIIDTTGLIAEPAGRVLKQFKIDLLRPDIVIALEYSNELEHILNGFKSQKLPKIYRLTVPVQVKSKSITLRTEFRINKFKSYFSEAQTVEVSFEDAEIRFTRDSVRLNTMELKDRVVSIRDERNWDIALGIIKHISQKERKILIRSPINKDISFATIVIGTAEIAL